MRTRWPWACVLLASITTAWADEPAYTIKIKTYPDEGESVLCREKDKQEILMREFNDRGKVVREDKAAEETEEVFTLTVLESGDKLPRRYRHTFEKATSSLIKNKTRIYQGSAIEYVMRGRKYRLELPEQPDIPKIEQELLLSRANSEVEAPLDEAFVPGKPVKVGESWKVSKDLLERSFGAHDKLDKETTEGSATLLKVYQKGGKQFGVIEISLTVGYITKDDTQFDPPGLFQIKGTLDTDIDGATNVGVLSLTTQLKGKAQIEREGVKLNREILAEGTTRKERSLPK
jgi:hypothetical protein